MKEIWKTPKSLHKPWFEVSNLGNCRIKQHVEEFIRLGKKCSRLSGSRKKRYTIDPRGRRQVLVSSQRNNKQYLAFVHRLVAECFVKNDNPSKNTMVFFKDNDFSNCRADNLFWADIKEKGLRMKCIHSIKVGIFYRKVAVKPNALVLG